jgi:uncharacterized protein YodC (DUF2158 family)
MAQFKVGDVVQLKSGGPLMTVGEVEGEQVTCEWFADKSEARVNVFTAAMLKVHAPPQLGAA